MNPAVGDDFDRQGQTRAEAGDEALSSAEITM